MEKRTYFVQSGCSFFSVAVSKNVSIIQIFLDKRGYNIVSFYKLSKFILFWKLLDRKGRSQNRTCLRKQNGLVNGSWNIKYKDILIFSTYLRSTECFIEAVDLKSKPRHVMVDVDILQFFKQNWPILCFQYWIE